MNRALWLLLWLQLAGWLRYLGRNLGTLRGALLAIVGLSVFVPWLIAVLASPGGGVGGLLPENLRLYGPAFLLFYCVLNVLFSSHERAIYFTPAEVQFLFTGPFGRREVLTYKLLLTVLVSVPATLFLGAIFRVRHGWLPAVLLGLLAISLFMQLFSMALGLMANALGEQLYGRGRKAAILVLVVCAAVVALQTGALQSGLQWRELAEEVFQTEVWKTLTWPLRVFFEVMLAQRVWPDLLVPLLAVAVVLVALVGLIFVLDAGYQEASAAASARIYARIQRMRGRAVSVDEPTQPGTARWSVPDLPYWGGVGPILWRQLTSALRGIGRLAGVLFILAVVLAWPAFSSNPRPGRGSSESLMWVMVGLGGWVSVFLTSLVPFDFRGDIDRLGTLKTLPIAPWRLALGQLLTPTLLLTLIQWLILSVALVISPPPTLHALAVAAYVPVFSFLVIALENLLFLFFPVRVMAATPGDFQALGRNVLLTMGKMLGLAVVGGSAAMAGVLTWLITGNPWAGVAAAWPVLAAAGIVLVPLCGLAFRWFDVGRDTPA